MAAGLAFAAEIINDMSYFKNITIRPFSSVREIQSKEQLNVDYVLTGNFIKLEKIDIKFIFNSKLGFSEIYLNGRNVENEIRRIDVSNKVSKIAAISAVRKKMVIEQHRMGQNKGIVMDGRDIGTVVFPDAELKIFMTASPDKRAHRRYNEMINKGDKVSYETVLKNVNDRDRIDTTRKDSPLVKASDAVELDNSNLTVEETFENVNKLALERIVNN